MENIIVDVGEYRISNRKDMILQSCLGSCVGVAIYDSKKKIGGLIHVLLPEARKTKDDSKLFRFADTGIPLLLKEMIKMGASKENITAKVAGGALIYTNRPENVNMNIGGKNCAMVIKILKREYIPLSNHDMGGNFGRVMQLHIATGKVTVRLIGEEEEEL